MLDGHLRSSCWYSRASSRQARRRRERAIPCAVDRQLVDSSPVRANATTVARVVAGQAVSIECEREASWLALGSRLDFDPALSWAVTPFHWSSERAGPAPDGTAHFSPQACRFGASFWLDPSDGPARTCRAALERLRNSGELVDHEQAACDVWASRLTAVHVLSHESVHLVGFYDEAQADCLALQMDAWVAMALGAEASWRARWRGSTGSTSTSLGSASIRAPSATTVGAWISSRHAPGGRRRVLPRRSRAPLAALRTALRADGPRP